MIVFNGKEVVLHYEEGRSDYVVVSFVGAFHETEAEWLYLLKDLAARENVSCLGFAVRERNFFRSSEMPAALDIAASITRKFGRVISIGHSMGGYACIKYSKAVNADYVISVSPHYSVNVEDLELANEAERKRASSMIKSAGIRFSALMEDMKITADDCRGRIVLVYNPRNDIDSYNARLCMKAVPSAYELPGYGIPHSILDHIHVPSWLDRLNGCFREGSDRNALFELRRLLYAEAETIETLIDNARKKHPVYCLRALISDRVSHIVNYDVVIGNGQNAALLYYHLSLKGYRTHGWAYLLYLMQPQAGAATSRSFDAILGGLDGAAVAAAKDALLISAHGTALCLDVVSGRLTFSDCLRAQPGLVRVRLRQEEGSPRLVVPLGNKVLTVKIAGGKSRLARAAGDDETRILWHKDGSLSIYDPEAGFLSAMPDSSTHTDAVMAGEWEVLVTVPLAGNGTVSLDARFAGTGWRSARRRARRGSGVDAPGTGAGGQYRRQSAGRYGDAAVLVRQVARLEQFLRGQAVGGDAAARLAQAVLPPALVV